MRKSKPGQPNKGDTHSAGSGPAAILDGPRVIDALADGLVPAQFYFNDLRVELRTPWTFLPGVGDTHTVIFVWDDHSGAPVDVLPPLRLDGPLTVDDFPIPALIPQAFLLNSANVDLSFRVYADYPADPGFDLSESVTIRIDRDAPGTGEVLRPAVFPVDPITDGYLNLNPLVPMQIPGGYQGREIGDEILLYFSDMNTLPAGAPTFVSAPLLSDTGPIIVDVPHTAFRSFPGASFIFCFYRLRDRAGNLNPQFSEVAQAGLQIDLPAPTYLRPDFPQAKTHVNGYMTCSNTPRIWFGVEVRISPGTAPSPGPVIQHGDLITMRFQGYRQYPDVDPYPHIVEGFTHVWDGLADAQGYSFWILDVERLIRPLKENAGGEASYLVHRGGTLIGRSFSRTVQFDRVVPVSPPPPLPLYCWTHGNGPEPETGAANKAGVRKAKPRPLF